MPNEIATPAELQAALASALNRIAELEKAVAHLLARVAGEEEAIDQMADAFDARPAQGGAGL